MYIPVRDWLNLNLCRRIQPRGFSYGKRDLSYRTAVSYAEACTCLPGYIRLVYDRYNIVRYVEIRSGYVEQRNGVTT